MKADCEKWTQAKNRVTFVSISITFLVHCFSLVDREKLYGLFMLQVELLRHSHVQWIELLISFTANVNKTKSYLKTRWEDKSFQQTIDKEN